MTRSGPTRALFATTLLAPAIALTGCSDGSSSAGGDRYAYDVPVAETSPWPMMRRTQRSTGASPVVPDTLADDPWRFPTGKGIFSVPVIGADGSVLVGSADRFFYSLSPEGELQWSFETGEIIDSAAAVGADGTTHVPSADGNLYALDADGNERWRFTAHHMAGDPEQLEGNQVIARFDASGYALAEHLPGIVVLDENRGRAVQIDDRAALSSTAGANGGLRRTVLTLPPEVAVSPGAGFRAVVVADLFPLASVEL